MTAGDSSTKADGLTVISDKAAMILRDVVAQA